MAQDKYHDTVKKALIKEGWKITDDPLRIDIGDRIIKIDLGAEFVLGAEKDGERIAVEIKSFLGLSQVYDFYNALGQFNYYSLALEKAEPDRILFLAVPSAVFNTFFKEPLTKEAVSRFNIRMIVYHIQEEKILSWEM